MRSRKSFVAADVIAGPVAGLRDAAHTLTNGTMQAILAHWQAIGFNGGLRNSTEVRNDLYKIILANIIDNYARQGAAE